MDMRPAAATPALCDYALDRHANALRWADLFRGLLFGFGVLFAFLILATIWFGMRATWGPVTLSGLGSAVSGGMTAWFAARRKEAMDDERQAYDDVEKACGDTTIADQRRLKLGIR